MLNDYQDKIHTKTEFEIYSFHRRKILSGAKTLGMYWSGKSFNSMTSRKSLLD